MQNVAAVTLTCCFIAMRFDAQYLPRALELLLSASGPIRAKHGCKASRVESDLTDSAVIRYTEEWDDGDAFKRHVKSQDFWRILVAMDLSSEEPQVYLGTFTGQSGLGSLSGLRKSADDPGTGMN